MSFKDIFSQSFLEGGITTDISKTTICLVMLITASMGIYIYGVYRIIWRKNFYSKNFNISLVVLALVTAAIILTIQSSVVISLGMVGALSIVRFRSAIKDPMDLVFLFWSISMGIICGAGLFTVAVITSAIITVLICVLEFVPVAQKPLLLVINSSDCEQDEEIINIIKKYTRVYEIKTYNITKKGMEMIIELRVKNGHALVKEIGKKEDIDMISLLSHNGEVIC